MADYIISDMQYTRLIFAAGNHVYGLMDEVEGELIKEGEVVRCKDCKHFESAFPFGFECYHIHQSGVTVNPNGFCAWGERRNDG